DSEDIVKTLKKNPGLLEKKAIILASKKWHPGIIPIITARISKQYNRPTIIISIDNGVGKGSIRTIPEFPLLQHLRDQKDLLINFGGHDFAAGLTIKEENIPAFTQNFIQAAEDNLKEKDISPKLYIDAKASFKEVTFDLMDSFTLLEPFGTDNPPPILYAKAKQAWPPKIVGKTHLKLYLEQDGRALEGIGFNMASMRKDLCKKNITLEIAYTPHVNNFLNKSSIQLIIKDFKICPY
ncbi:MAG: single-stranded-DNA-specific exonuclease RecJ, partial [Chlamydiia bacterium]|nr:single-stranded-DNA-specific exonuclease RecJ [Chlamydiia bacterium]